ncbi:MAG: ribonuclease M5 [Firmicutes bacterium]|nr:ribonuclease M5 [Bacillota bacterium]
MAERLKIRRAVIVEGRDDTCNLKRAVDCYTIETHGFGISGETYREIEKAYGEKGIIIFTDPDHAGAEIRRKLTERFPGALQVYLTRDEALKDGDIGVENASPEAIIQAFEKALALENQASSQLDELSEGDLFERGLAGASGSGELRQKLAKELGIGYGNARSFLIKLNAFGIGKEELDGALLRISKE